MKRLLIALAASMLALSAAHAQQRPVVNTASGPVRGVVDGETTVFKGIPFAAPPTGELRWAPPASPKAWTELRDAADYGPICPQPKRPDGVVAAGADRPQSEDCLYLNIWSPKAAKHVPVMVWIHGGAHRVGSGEGPVYEGGAFARDGVILVTLNYRLGAFGYFAHPALTHSVGPDAPLGNYGLMDQMAALAWVKKNIAAFGGDPGNVTVFGESAGGSSVLALLTTPSAKWLFDKAIVESGGGGQREGTLAEEEARGVQRATRFGLTGATATVAELRAVPADKVVEPLGGSGAAGVGPFVDGRQFKESPAQAFASGHVIDVPLIIGSNSYEASLMRIFPIPVAAALARMTPDQKAAYAGLASDNAIIDALYTDSAMGAPARWIAGKESGGAPSYLYYFSYVSTAQRGKVPGAIHGSEIIYVFETGPKVAVIPPSASDLAVAHRMHSCWIGFAKTGAPTCKDMPAWPAYDPAHDQLMEFGETSEVRTHFRQPMLDADLKAANLK